jgi:hypothetical protein
MILCDMVGMLKVRWLKLSLTRCSAVWGELWLRCDTCESLSRLLMPVEVVWWAVVLAGIQAVQQGGKQCRVSRTFGLRPMRLLDMFLLCSRPFQKLPPRSGLPCLALLGMIDLMGWGDVGY